MSTVPQLETLREEIEAKKKFIASLPDCRGNADVFFRAKHQKILGEKEEELDLLLEAQRRADVVREHEELHPPYTEECPICLEDVRVVTADSMRYFVCCGNGFCKGCFDASQAKIVEEGDDVLPKCPMCRAKIPINDAIGNEYAKRKIELQAKNGRAWAQFQIAVNTFIEDNWCSVGKTGAMKWLQRAVEQRFPPAVALLADLYRGDHDGGNIVEPSPSKARALYEDAADLGVPRAQAHLGRMHNLGEGGPVDHEKALFYSTLGYPDERAVYQLGRLFFHGEGVSKSLCISKDYFEQAAEMGERRACCYLAPLLLEICTARYNGRTDIPGHSCIPRTLYWARRAADDVLIREKMKGMITRIEEEGKKSCANCHTDALRLPDPLKRCVRCRAVWYCGKECQQEHWKAGHKIDCIKQE